MGFVDFIMKHGAMRCNDDALEVIWIAIAKAEVDRLLFAPLVSGYVRTVAANNLTEM
jgi:hypothetical protein